MIMIIMSRILTIDPPSPDERSAWWPCPGEGPSLLHQPDIGIIIIIMIMVITIIMITTVIMMIWFPMLTSCVVLSTWVWRASASENLKRSSIEYWPANKLYKCYKSSNLTNKCYKVVGVLGFSSDQHWQIKTRVYEDSKKASTFDDANHHITSQQRPLHHIPSQFIIIIKIIKIIKIIHIIKIIKIIILIYFLAMPSTPDVSPYERLLTAPSTAERPSLKADS